MQFKERVLQNIIDGAKIYKDVFVDYEYLVYSSQFNIKPYYIVSAEENNYPHLTGVNLLLPAQEFYDKALMGTLQESDFNFIKPHTSEKVIIGTVRRKIQVIPQLTDLFLYCLRAEENFAKGTVHCSMATTDGVLTIGFVDAEVARPKTLLKGNELNSRKTVDVELVLRRNRSSGKFDTVMQGNMNAFCALYPDIFVGK